ncbi:MAG: DUF6036 family nucleotidyltransferase [Pirellulaceae bacterium]|nr:hypothetical protein [Planctomycetales bacterium]
MSQAEFLKKVFEVLDRLEVAAMLVGSHASSYYGESRSTHDIDILIDLPKVKVASLVAAFPKPRYYLSESALLEGRMANLIDTEQGDKVDFFMLDSSASRQQELARRKSINILGARVWMATVEDTIVAKLRWSQDAGGSDRQIRDVEQMIIQQKANIDREYLSQRIHEEALSETWSLVSDLLD